MESADYPGFVRRYEAFWGTEEIHRFYFPEGADLQSAGDGGGWTGEQKGLRGGASQSGVYAYGYRLQSEAHSGRDG